MQFESLRIGQSARWWLHRRIGAQALLAAGNTAQLLVGAAIPVPVGATFEEGRIERAAMDALGLGQRAVDIEDQGAGLSDSILQAAGAEQR